MPRVETTVTITNRLGLHARPAMTFVDLASTFACEVTVKKDDTEVDGKSIMQMMMLAASKGTKLELICEGENADAGLAALKALVDGGFDEE
jgi:phosphocarrier protein HPr